MWVLNLADGKKYNMLSLIDDFIESIKNDNLPFVLAVLMHQLMWSWIYSELKNGRMVCESDFWNLMGLTKAIQTDTYCFLYNSVGCSNCPARGSDFLVDVDVTCALGYYSLYRRITALHPTNIFVNDMANIAYKIATIKITNKEGDIL